MVPFLVSFLTGESFSKVLAYSFLTTSSYSSTLGLVSSVKDI